QIAHESFPAGNQLVGEDEPGTGLDPPALERVGKIRHALRPYFEIILQHDRLTVEQKARAARRRVIEQLVDERDKSLPESFGGMVPLAIPMRVGDDVNGEQ